MGWPVAASIAVGAGVERGDGGVDGIEVPLDLAERLEVAPPVPRRQPPRSTVSALGRVVVGLARRARLAVGQEGRQVDLELLGLAGTAGLRAMGSRAGTEASVTSGEPTGRPGPRSGAARTSDRTRPAGRRQGVDQMSVVLVDKPEPQVAVVTLNRPERLNAMSIELVLELAERAPGDRRRQRLPGHRAHRRRAGRSARAST